METEIWKDLKNYEGYYKINNFGIIKSVKRKYYSGKKHLAEKVREEEYITSRIGVRGYISYMISKRVKMAHRLVAETFILNPDNKPFVNHINGIKTDNRVENLEWCTAKENVRHAIRTGLMKTGSNSVRAKLTSQQVEEIRALSGTMLQKDIAKLFNIRKQLTSKIIRNERYVNYDSNKHSGNARLS